MPVEPCALISACIVRRTQVAAGIHENAAGRKHPRDLRFNGILAVACRENNQNTLSNCILNFRGEREFGFGWCVRGREVVSSPGASDYFGL